MVRRRSRGEGSVFFVEKKGLWAGQVTLPDGRRKMKYNKKQQVVRDWVLTERKKLSEGIFVTDDKITLSSFLRRYLEEHCKRTIAPTTFIGYQQVIENHIIPELGNVKLKDLRADQINHLLDLKLKVGLSDRFVEYVHGIMKRSLNVALKWGLITKNPATLVKPPKVKFKIPDVWSAEQVKTFLESVQSDRWKAIYYLAMTGMRKSEILGLPISALSLEQGSLMIVQNLQYVPKQGLLTLEPKTENSRRRIMLPEFIQKSLREHMARRRIMSQIPSWKESGLVFTTDIGTPIFPRNLNRHFKEKLEKAGLPDIRFHDLRHTTASILFEKNTHPLLVSQLLGHTSIKTTIDRYTHFINPMSKVVADTLDDAVSGTA